MRGAPLALSLTLALAATGGCATTPPATEAAIPGGGDVARSVVPCTTTLGELAPRLAPPSRDGRLGDLRVLTWIVEWEPLVRYLGVAVDARGVVVDRVWDLPSEVPWTPVDRCRR